MEALYPFFIAFTIIFLAELGDKTQILVMSFATKSRIKNILIGVALGTFFSHGLAIIFGSSLGLLENGTFVFYLKIATYITFLLLGIFGFIKKEPQDENSHKEGIIQKLAHTSLNYIFIVAISIVIGELGDKTFIASMGLGLQYPNYKLSLIAGAILGMVVSNFIAIIFGRWLSQKVSNKYINIVSNLIFIAFGAIGIVWNVFFVL